MDTDYEALFTELLEDVMMLRRSIVEFGVKDWAAIVQDMDLIIEEYVNE